MLGFSIPKLVVLAAILAAVWYGFKFLGRIDRDRKADAKASIKSGRKRRQDAGDARADDVVEEMVRCDACDAFVAAAKATSCGREDCPYPG